MHEGSIFTELSLVLIVVAIVALAVHWLRQPLILGYILTGILVGPAMLDLIHAKEAFHSFSEIGIALLLFIIGLGMNPHVIRSLGKVSLITAGSILLLVGGTGALITYLMGMSIATAIIIGLALFFSSTIIILKILSDKKEVNRLHGQVAIGVILVDDVVATLAIVAVAAVSQGGNGVAAADFGILAVKAIILGLGLVAAGRWILPWLSRKMANSQELLFVFAIAWGFGVASLFAASGFSLEVGALFAGVALANLPYAAEMSSRLKPLRDFFVVLFFVYLGEQFIFDSFGEVIIPALILSALVVIGKPIFVMASLGALRYTKLTSFKTGIHLSQISEFSIVLVVFAVAQGVVDPQAASIITLVALITIAVSSYLMKYDDELYRKLEKYLRVFERKETHERKEKHELYNAILFGYHHGGHEFLQMFRDMRKHYLVVDHDPEIIDQLETQGIRHAYGDATDSEFLDEINAGHAQLVASSVLDKSVNIYILTYLHRFELDTAFICHAQTYEEALELYKHGASYVILPRFFGGGHITNHIKKHGLNKKSLAEFREHHIASIGKQAIDS